MKRSILVAAFASAWGAALAACLSSTTPSSEAGVSPPDATDVQPPPPPGAPLDGAIEGGPTPMCDTVDAGRGDGAVPSGSVACPGGTADLATDRANCGACGHDCKTTSCANGECTPETIASAPVGGYVANLLTGADGLLVYAGITGGAFGATGPLITVQTDGGAQRTLSASEASWTGSVAALNNGGELAFTLNGGPHVVRALDVNGTDGGITIPLMSQATAIAVSSTAVYFASPDGVQRADVSSGAVDAVAADTDTTSMASDNTAIYWSRVPADGGAGEVVRYASSTLVRSSSVGAPAGIVVDAAWVYVYDGSTRTVARMPKTVAGASPETLATLDRPDLGYLLSIVADDASVFLALRPTGVNCDATSIYRISKCGGAPFLIATLPPCTWTSLSVDDAYVYASRGSDIVRLPK